VRRPPSGDSSGRLLAPYNRVEIMPPYSAPPPNSEPLRPRQPEAPPTSEEFVPDVRKVFGVGFFLGMAIATLLLFLYPAYETHREIVRAETAVQVKQIMGGCK